MTWRAVTRRDVSKRKKPFDYAACGLKLFKICKLKSASSDHMAMSVIYRKEPFAFDLSGGVVKYYPQSQGQIQDICKKGGGADITQK